MQTTSAGKLQMGVGDGANTGGEGTTFTTGSTTLSTNTWYHLAFIYNGSDCKAYLNGSEELNAVLETSITGNANAFEIGRLYFSSTYYYATGDIANVGVWSGLALSAAQVGSLYNNGLGLRYY